MKLTVVIPAFRRGEDLARCLAAVRGQERAADEVLVTVRPDDAASIAVVRSHRAGWDALREVSVDRAGVVAAMNAALDVATGDIIAFTDDDAEPYADWLERLATAIDSAPDVGGAGGRDEQAGKAPASRSVGRVQWFGRVIGNHHIGTGEARFVDVLKGVNCAFRTTPLRQLRFDERLRGSGAQVHWELAVCLAMRRAGWRLVYDPSIRVRHHVAERVGDDKLHRGIFSAAAHHDAVYNESVALLDHPSRLQRGGFHIWATLVGTAEAPGLLQLPRVIMREGTLAFERFSVTHRARAEARASKRINGRASKTP